ncbi:MAG: GldG family protein [Candidatus Omnitrophica bacterium]|nr:GldG family protein [Candidatus Omnitrophota bacterium]
MNKLLYVIFILGVIIFLGGIGVMFIDNRFSGAMEVGLIILGLISILYPVYRVKILQTSPVVISKRRIWEGIRILLILTLFVELNYLGLIYNKRLDLTKFKQHTLLPQTHQEIEALKKDIRMTAFHVGVPPKYLEDLLNEYQRASKGRITVEIIDPLVRIGYAAQFGTTISANEKKLFVQSGPERREIDFTRNLLTQEGINNTIMQLTRKTRTACFLTGHGESRLEDDKTTGLNKFSKHLSTNNIMSKEVEVDLIGGIPDDCSVLVVAGPKKFLTVKEERIILDYLAKGGDALFLIENTLVTTPEVPLTVEQEELNPSLNNIFREWGIAVAKDVVVDLDSHASGDVGSPATRNYMSHRAIVKGLDYTFFVRPRSIKMLKDRKQTVKLAPLILTTSEKNSWGETNRNLTVKLDVDDRAGPVPIAFVLMQPKQAEGLSDTRIIVITDADFISNEYIDFYSNAQLGANAVNWLTELDYVAYLDQTQVKITQLDLTSRQKRIVAFILFLVPSLLISTGLLFWLKQ